MKRDKGFLLLEEALRLLSRYERMEATTLLELSLLKMELKSARAIVDKDGRGAYQIRSGAPVVIPNVIAFLYKTSDV